MAETYATLLARVQQVVAMHNLIRAKLLPWSDDRSHFVNENTVVRLAAALEAGGVRAPSGVATGKEPWGETCVRTLFLFRNTILHECAGVYDPGRLRGSHRHLRAYDAFCDAWPRARVDPGTMLCLATDAVTTPLLEGCLEYCRGLCG
jgi:hypothetical protein